MPPELVTAAATNEWGFCGVVVVCLFSFLLWVLKNHSEERKQWMDKQAEDMKVQQNLQSATNEVMRDLSVVVATLKTAIGK